MATKRDAPTLFISYRRDDAGGRAGRLCDWLKRQFGTAQVFLDTDKIAAGADFVQVLDERLAAADVVLVVIGDTWATIANEDGRRLDQPDDFVRQEVLAALTQDKRVIPVLVGGASMPDEADLPEPLKPLHRHNAVSVDDASFDRDFNALVDEILQRPRGYLRREVDRLTRLIRALKLTSLLVPALATVAVFAVWIGLLAPLNLDTMAQNTLLWAADELDPLPEHPGVLLVAIDEASEAAFGPVGNGPSAPWRRRHAQLIERARQAGARTVAFDIGFTQPTDADGALAEAIRAARDANPPMRVVLGGHALDGDAPDLAPRLRNAPWGSTCLLRRHQRYAVPLAVLAPPDRLTALVPVRQPAFALVAAVGNAIEEADVDRRSLRVSGQPAAQAPRFSDISRIKTDLCDTLHAGDDAAILTIRPSAADYWSDPARRRAYAEVLDPQRTPDTHLAGRILLVGDTRRDSDDRHALRRGWQTRAVPGVELHAEAIAALVNHRETVLPTVDQALALLAGASLAGAAARFFTSAWPRGRRRALLALMCLGYIVLAVLLATSGFLLNLPYELTAFALTWFVLGRLLRSERSTEGAT